jgi:3'(2'), 5'-bisphosphate nucleotidase
MTGPELERLLAPVREAVQRAGAAVLDVYGSDFEVYAKTDLSPVTEADIASERIILPVLTDLTPDIPVVSEEQVEAHGLPTIASGPFWLVDPLDGTKEFIARNGEFTVNVALIEGGSPVFGVVSAPALGQLYAGLRPADGPARALALAGAGEAQEITARRTPAEGATVITSRSHRDSERLEAYLMEVHVAARRISGSSLKFCVLAKGEADLYPRFGPTNEWDTAAGHAVLAAAGGSVDTLDGAPLAYGKEGLVNPPFIARGRGD